MRTNARLWRLLLGLWLSSAALWLVGGLPASAVAASGPGTILVEATGHTLGGSFRDYWEQRGGLVRFGYPISEPFVQRSPFDGRDYRTQYFERAVLEEHPETTDPDWMIQMRHLGRDLIAGREHEQPFRPISASAANGRLYFPEVGHALGGSFRARWEQTGGLPVYGFPLSEEFVERSPTNNQPYLVQYFERARFELHPEYAGSTAEILLGLLGRQAADRERLGGSSPFATFSRHLPVNWHRQMTDHWCDPSNIQSWTEYLIGRNYPDDMSIQSQIWDYELAHNLGYTVEEWDASPYAMAAALRWLNPTVGFNHWTFDDPVDATRVMAYLMARPGRAQPAIAVIRGGTHYILVKGVATDYDPAATYPNFTIRGVWVSDPYIGYPGSETKWLGEDTFLTLDQWLAIFTPNQWGVPGDPWQQKYVLVQADWQSMEPLPAGRTLADFRSWIKR